MAEHGGGHAEHGGGGGMEFGNFYVPGMLREVFKPEDFLEKFAGGLMADLFGGFIGGPFIKRGGGGGGGHH